MWNIVLTVTTRRYENRNNPSANCSEEYRFTMKSKPSQEVIQLLEDSHNKVRGNTTAVVTNVFNTFHEEDL